MSFGGRLRLANDLWSAALLGWVIFFALELLRQGSHKGGRVALAVEAACLALGVTAVVFMSVTYLAR